MGIFRFLAIFLVALLVSGTAWAEKRVALVIGNNDYSSLPDLNNAKKDATDMARKLKGLGFEVVLKTNAGRRDMYRAIDEFARMLSGGDTALVFYAGHGIQADGKNYLIPANADVETEADLEPEALTSKRFLTAMSDAGVGLSMMILDACRDNPLPKRKRSAARGLAVVSVPQGASGTAVLYSAGPGQTAEDGDIGGNGVFTGALLKALDKPGLTIEQVFKETVKAVSRKTNKRQKPWINASLSGNFYFKSRTAQTPTVSTPAPTVAVDKEAMFWDTIKHSTDAADFEAYLEQYPKGAFAALARVKVKKYEKQQVAVVTPSGRKAVQYTVGNTLRDCLDCPEMVVIPAGSFRMGNLGGGGDDDEKPVHTVTIPKPFAIGKFEVTQDEWRSIMGSNPSFFKGGRNPVGDISWQDAKQYVRKLSAKTGKEYRLLSEAEWEYMARAGSSTKYPWGDDMGSGKAVCNGCGSRWDNKGSAPVGSFQPNAFGVYDTVGNVWEWVEDCWNENYKGAPNNGEPWTGGNCSKRVLRSGDHDSDPREVRSINRNRDASDNEYYLYGVRVARTLSP